MKPFYTTQRILYRSFSPFFSKHCCCATSSTSPLFWKSSIFSSSSSSKTMASPKRQRFPSLFEFVGRSQEYSNKFIDSHCHIDLLFNRYGLSKDYSYSKFIKEHADSFPSNYEGCVAIFCDPKTFSPKDPDTETLSMAGGTPGVHLALGCHPKNAMRFTDGHLPSLRAALQNPKVVALGEIGLDYAGGFDATADKQKEVFRQQLSLAVELGLPLVIHCRDADDDCLDILKELVPPDWPIHRHCFTQDRHTAQKWLTAFSRMYLGFTPLIMRNSASVAPIREAARITPNDRLLLETDAPYFVPEGVRKGVKLSHPGYALFTAEALARIKGTPVDTILQACRANTRDFYGV